MLLLIGDVFLPPGHEEHKDGVHQEGIKDGPGSIQTSKKYLVFLGVLGALVVNLIVC
jgi:hypothetical protein